MRLDLNLLPEEIILQNNLRYIAKDGYVYLEICKGMYGFTHASMLVNNHLNKILGTYGFIPAAYTPGLWRKQMCPIYFTLVVDDFGVKYLDQ